MATALPFSIDQQFLEALATKNYATDESVDSKRIPRTAIQLVLLRQTLERVYEQTEFYKEWMDAVAFSPYALERISDLASLPILTREVVELHRERMVAQNTEITGLRSTSGTTRGHALPIYSDATEEACSILLARLQGAEIKRNEEDIVLHVKPATQRLGSPSKALGFELVATFNIDAPAPFRMDVGYDEFIIQLLFERFSRASKSGRVNVLRCVPPFMLRMLTQAMLRRGISPKDTSIRTLLTAGGTVTDDLVEMAENLWNAKLKSVYSCAEIRGYAPQVGDGARSYSFGLDVLAEILSPDSGRPVDMGEDGLLVLTTLYPFQSAQPFIRYSNGDIVRKVEVSDSDETVFTYRGRRGQCPTLAPLIGNAGKNLVVGTAEIEAALSTFREIPFDFAPRFRLDVSEHGLIVDVETLALVGDEWERNLRLRLEEKIGRALGELYPHWRWPIGVRLHAKGTLASPFRLYPAR